MRGRRPPPMGPVVLPLAEMVPAGHGTRRLPIRVRCRDCGEVGELQVTPPEQTRRPGGWMEMHDRDPGVVRANTLSFLS